MPSAPSDNGDTSYLSGKVSDLVATIADTNRRIDVRDRTLDAIADRLESLESRPVGTGNGSRGPTDAEITDLVTATVSTAVGLATGTIRDKVSAAIAEMLPTRHEVVIRRPDGSQITRDGRPHRQFGLLLDVLATREPIMLVGPAGSGKTTAASMAAEAMGLAYYETSLGPQSSQADLLGYRSPLDGTYYKGAVRDAFEHGGVCLLDELDASNPAVMTCLNAILANGHAGFADGVVQKHPDFVLVASANTYGRGADRQYVGRQQMDAATLDRYVVLSWDYDEDAELDWASNRAWAEWVIKVRHAAAELGERVIVSPRASIKGSKLLAQGIDRETVADMVLWKGISADIRNKIMARIGE